jgi:hypothetical protein
MLMPSVGALIGCFVLLALTAGCEQESMEHRVTVANGSGSGRYILDQEVIIEADSSMGDQLFAFWSGSDTALLDDPFRRRAKLRMPLRDLYFEAVYKASPRYPLLITDGQGGGQFPEGARVRITADAPADTSLAFWRWEGDTAYLDAVRAASAWVTMPAAPVRLAAAYQNLPTYALTVENGTGSGDYLAGAVIELVAEPPEAGTFFLRWAGGADTALLADPRKARTRLTMPDRPISLRAEFRQAVSFNRVIAPLIERRCANAGCHDGGPFSRQPTLTNYGEIARETGDIREAITIGVMADPNFGNLSAREVQLIVQWIDSGAPNN